MYLRDAVGSVLPHLSVQHKESVHCNMAMQRLGAGDEVSGLVM